PDWAVVELTKDGRLDNSFGTGGVALIDFGYNVTLNGLANFIVKQDGSILLGGTVIGNAGVDFAVAELTKDGRLNKSFGNGGETLVSFGPVAVLQNFVIEQDATIVLAGTTFDPNTSIFGFGLAELTKDGSLRTAFGTGGTTQV